KSRPTCRRSAREDFERTETTRPWQPWTAPFTEQPSTPKALLATATEELREGNYQAQSARISRAFFTSSSEPAKSTFTLPNFRVTATLTVVKPLFFIRRWICLYASLAL